MPRTDFPSFFLFYMYVLAVYNDLLISFSVAPDKEKCQALVQLFVSFLNDEILLQFIKLFLLQSNSSSLRWQAHSLLHTLYIHGTGQVRRPIIPQYTLSYVPIGSRFMHRASCNHLSKYECVLMFVQDQSHVVELLWQMWPDMPTYGWKASQFVDLLGYCTISTPHIMEKVSTPLKFFLLAALLYSYCSLPLSSAGGSLPVLRREGHRST